MDLLEATRRVKHVLAEAYSFGKEDILVQGMIAEVMIAYERGVKDGKAEEREISMKEKRCVVCGNREGYSAPGDNLTENDRKLKRCEKCDRIVCGFCSHLGVCCEMDEEEGL